ncbi:MAG: hypothetical protein K0S45_3573 [Nitrospira sp.]|jgi:hypothetical protein|nr:hypothetical protein [Nitrospira sp.]
MSAKLKDWENVKVSNKIKEKKAGDLTVEDLDAIRLAIRKAATSTQSVPGLCTCCSSS